MKTIPIFLLLLCALNLGAQPFSSTFEIRYFTKDTKANGETDFKGETEWLNLNQRILFLEKYADYASKFFNNRNFNNEIVTDSEVRELVSRIKPQPLTGIRTTMVLDDWKSYGYKSGQDLLRKKEIESWKKSQGTSVAEGHSFIQLEGYNFKHVKDGVYAVNYNLYYK